jgi:hypothetical protein
MFPARESEISVFLRFSASVNRKLDMRRPFVSPISFDQPHHDDFLLVADALQRALLLHDVSRPVCADAIAWSMHSSMATAASTRAE